MLPLIANPINDLNINGNVKDHDINKGYSLRDKSKGINFEDMLSLNSEIDNQLDNSELLLNTNNHDYSLDDESDTNFESAMLYMNPSHFHNDVKKSLNEDIRIQDKPFNSIYESGKKDDLSDDQNLVLKTPLNANAFLKDNESPFHEKENAFNAKEGLKLKQNEGSFGNKPLQNDALINPSKSVNKSNQPLSLAFQESDNKTELSPLNILHREQKAKRELLSKNDMFHKVDESLFYDNELSQNAQRARLNNLESSSKDLALKSHMQKLDLLHQNQTENSLKVHNMQDSFLSGDNANKGKESVSTQVLNPLLNNDIRLRMDTIQKEDTSLKNNTLRDVHNLLTQKTPIESKSYEHFTKEVTVDNNLIESTHIERYGENGKAQLSEKYNFTLKNDDTANFETVLETPENPIEESFSIGGKVNTLENSYQSSPLNNDNESTLHAREIIHKTIEKIKNAVASPISNEQKLEATLELKDIQFGKINIQLSVDHNRKLELSIVSQNQELSDEIESNIEELKESLSSHKIILNDIKISTQGTNSNMDSNAHQDSSKQNYLTDSSFSNSENTQNSEGKNFKDHFEHHSNSNKRLQNFGITNSNQTSQRNVYQARSINNHGHLSISA